MSGTWTTAARAAARTAALVAAVAASAGAAAAQTAAGDAADRRLTVTGQAEVEAVPDMALATAGVETQAATAAEALEANSVTMAAIFGALDAAGIAARDMQTSELNLGPLYAPEVDASGSGQRVVAFQASNLVTVRVRDLAALGRVIDALAGVGANRLYGVRFDITEPRPHLDEARTRAVADARARAELYAKAAGVTLGPVLAIREAIEMPGPVMMRAEAMSDAAPPIAGGTVALTAQVEIVWAIE